MGDFVLCLAEDGLDQRRLFAFLDAAEFFAQMRVVDGQIVALAGAQGPPVPLVRDAMRAAVSLSSWSILRNSRKVICST